jgi:hypothetical protein
LRYNGFHGDILMNYYRSAVLPALVIVAVSGSWPSNAVAGVVEDLTIPEMAARATIVVHGTVGQVDMAWDESHTRIFTTVDIDVISYFSGQGPRTVRIRQVGGRVGDTELRVIGQPTFRTGEEVVVFLEPDGSRVPGSWVVLCMAAGKFSVTIDETTGELVLSRDLGEISSITVRADRGRPIRRSVRPLLLRDLEGEVRRTVRSGGTP